MRVLPFFTILVTLLVSSLSVPRGPELVWDVHVVALTDSGSKQLGQGGHHVTGPFSLMVLTKSQLEAALRYLEHHGDAKLLRRLTSRGEFSHVDATWLEGGVRVGLETELFGEPEEPDYLLLHMNGLVHSLDYEGNAVRERFNQKARIKLGDTIGTTLKGTAQGDDPYGKRLTYGGFDSVVVLVTPTAKE